MGKICVTDGNDEGSVHECSTQSEMNELTLSQECYSSLSLTYIIHEIKVLISSWLIHTSSLACHIYFRPTPSTHNVENVSFLFHSLYYLSFFLSRSFALCIVIIKEKILLRLPSTATTRWKRFVTLNFIVFSPPFFALSYNMLCRYVFLQKKGTKNDDDSAG
jgi:hypothetical protein